MTETPTWIRRAASGLREPEAQRRMPLGDLPPTPNTMFEMMRSMQAKIGLLEQRNQVLAACAGVASDGPAVSNATKIQKSWRRFCAVRVLRHACTSAALIQSVFRGLHQRKVFRAHKEAAVTLEAAVRRRLCTREYTRKVWATVRLQATSRRRSAWRSLAAARLAITRLQARERARSTSRDFQRQRQSAAVIQSRLRCYATEVLHNERVSKTSLILTSVKQREEICHLRRLLSVATQANVQLNSVVSKLEPEATHLREENKRLARTATAAASAFALPAASAFALPAASAFALPAASAFALPAASAFALPAASASPTVATATEATFHLNKQLKELEEEEEEEAPQTWTEMLEAKYSNEVEDDSDEDYDYDFDQKLEEARAEEVLEYESDEEGFGAQLRALVEDGFELDQSGFTIEQMKDAMHAIGISTAGIIGPGGTPDRQELITLVKRTIAARSTEEVGDAVMGDFEADEA